MLLSQLRDKHAVADRIKAASSPAAHFSARRVITDQLIHSLAHLGMVTELDLLRNFNLFVQL